jgi:hypothetical protein
LTVVASFVYAIWLVGMVVVGRSAFKGRFGIVVGCFSSPIPYVVRRSVGVMVNRRL